MRECTRAGHEVIGLAFSRVSGALVKLDLTDAEAIHGLIQRERPDVVINLAAERRPDVVERDPVAVRKLNVDAPAILAQACATLNPPAYLLNISTDYVFDGQNPPYFVDSPTHPLNAYGMSKREGEIAVLDAALPGYATNLRLPVLYGETLYNEESAVNVLLNSIRSNGKRIKMDAHAVRYPTNVSDVAHVIEQLASLYKKQLHSSGMPETLHFSAPEAMTKYDMCLVLSRLWNLVCKEEVSSVQHLDPQYEADPNAGTKRPGHCKLDISATKELGIDTSCVPFDEWWCNYLERCDRPAPLHGESKLGNDFSSTMEAALPEEDAKVQGASELSSNVKKSDTSEVSRESAHETGTCSKGGTETALPISDEEERYGTRTPNEHENDVQEQPKVEFCVRVGDPQRVGDPMTAHVVYTVRVQTNAPWLSRPEYSVLRRYNDFRWLHAAMVHNHPGVVVPPIPEKVKVGRFAPELVEFRRRFLERALLKMLQHPILQQDDDLALFLESGNLIADIHQRDLRKGPVVTPEYKTYFGWSHAFHQYRFQEPDDWFILQLNYLSQFETRMSEICDALTNLSHKRAELADAYLQLYHSLVALSSSGMSRSVSTCFAILADMKKRSAQACTQLADHEANVFGLALYEYERLVGSIRKAFQSREEVWQAWQCAEDELSRVRSKYAKSNETHIDTQNHALTHTQLAYAALSTRFEEVTRLCKLEVERFECGKAQEIRKAFEEYVRVFSTIQRDILDEWEHCGSIVQRIITKNRNKIFSSLLRLSHMLDCRSA
ncbi:Vacuolar protein sorting-associated protein vps5 [Malassezia arunalokei]|uniref:Vacuolar protein sorting-associated protein vps5 n=1 Tax=Malassezia arunalokei TaxID=1514897 RepID=A0AAJ5Z104_9BASI|nr:Vacuolar protein sorting-associated protein vps5 [Malassezia arunalokei]